jgi:hypothetical protein
MLSGDSRGAPETKASRRLFCDRYDEVMLEKRSSGAVQIVLETGERDPLSASSAHQVENFMADELTQS